MSFKPERVAQKVRGNYEPGISHTDNFRTPLIGTQFSVLDPEISWLDYQCWVECELDSGIVVHRPLPQRPLRQRSGNPPVPDADSLGGVDVDNNGLHIGSTRSVNLKSKDDFQDVPQRMATSRYRFCLKGFAWRVGHLIPIPKLESVAGVMAVPDDEKPQKAVCRLVGGNSGVPLYFAMWELWYTVVRPPKKPQTPPANLAQHIRADAPLPNGIQVPIAGPDDNATRDTPPGQPPDQPGPNRPGQNQPTITRVVRGGQN